MSAELKLLEPLLSVVNAGLGSSASNGAMKEEEKEEEYWFSVKFYNYLNE